MSASLSCGPNIKTRCRESLGDHLNDAVILRSEDMPGYIEHDRVRFILDDDDPDLTVLTIQRGTHILMNMDHEVVSGDGDVVTQAFLGVGEVQAVLEVPSYPPTYNVAHLLCICLSTGQMYRPEQGSGHAG